MSELSIFIDESGDFGPYDYRSPYYIITMVFHDQSVDISTPITKLEADLSNRGFPNHCVHTGPIIRRENEYEFETIETRRRILNSMVTFIKHCNVKYHGFLEIIMKNYFLTIRSRYTMIMVRSKYPEYLPQYLLFFCLKLRSKR